MHKYWPHLIISQHCYHCQHTVSTYQHEFFECGIMPQIWQVINQMLDDAGLPSKLTSIAGLPEFLYEAHNPRFNLRKIVNTNLIIVTLKAVWYAYQDKQNMTAHKYSRDIRRRLAMYITNEIKLLPCHIDNAYKHGYNTTRGNARPRKQHSERAKTLLNKSSLRLQSLTDDDIDAYEDISRFWDEKVDWNFPKLFFEQGLNRFFMAKKVKRRRFGRFSFFFSRAVPIYLLIPEP